jgi:hypothetical protein
MSEVNDQTEDAEITAALRAAPSWMTPEAVRDTLEVFRPLYKERLTVSDAIEILISYHNLFDVLKEQIEKPSTVKKKG